VQAGLKLGVMLGVCLAKEFSHLCARANFAPASLQARMWDLWYPSGHRLPLVE